MRLVARADHTRPEKTFFKADVTMSPNECLVIVSQHHLAMLMSMDPTDPAPASAALEAAKLRKIEAEIAYLRAAAQLELAEADLAIQKARYVH